MPHSFGHDTPLTGGQAEQLLDELEGHRQLDVQQARDLSSMALEAPIVVRPADVCARRTVVAEGVTTELQRAGASCMFDGPVTVGSVFHLSFDRGVVDQPPVLAVCDRCAMFGDTAFEVHFRFTQEISFPPPTGQSKAT